MGFVALATSSGAAAGVLGRRDGMITRDKSLANARTIVEATELPVSADLEKGFGDAPADAALTIRLRAKSAWLAAPSRMRQGIHKSRCSMRRMRRSGWPRRWKQPVPCHFLSP